MALTRKRSSVCRELKRLLAVGDAWIAQEFDDGRWIEVAVILSAQDTDPAGSIFRSDVPDRVRNVVRSAEPAGRCRVRVVRPEAVAN